MPTHADDVIRQESLNMQRVQDQAKRYMEGVYGKSIWYQAPEVETNVLIRWVRAIASGEIDFAEEHMAHIEQMIQEQKEQREKEDGHRT